MTPDQLLNSLRDYKVKIHEHAGWRTRRHGTLNPGVIVVHDSVTGSMDDERAANFCAAGRSDLQGPLYEALVGRDGTVHLIAFGVTWHSGRGNDARLAQAKRGTMPLDRELGRPGADNTGAANGIAHGISYITAGAGPYTEVQREAGYRVVAAYAHAEGWGQYGAGSTIGHGEFSSRKIDPQLDMGTLRTRVNALLTGGSSTDELWHTVVAGDTLWNLSKKYGVPVDELRQLNNMDEDDVLKLGTQLRIS